MTIRQMKNNKNVIIGVQQLIPFIAAVARKIA